MSDERTLIISRHAVAAYSRRRNDSRSLRELEDADWDLRSLRRQGLPQEDLQRLVDFYGELEREIKECVLYSIKHGLLLDHKPNGFVLYRRKRASLPQGQRFVRCSDDSNFGFILKRLPATESGPGEDIVVTTLTKAGVRR